jgi:large subunit ribosomal protein L10
MRKEVNSLAITREKKDELIAQYKEDISRSQGMIVIDYRGLTVKQIEELRKRVRVAKGSFVVTKNTLLARALKDTGMPVSEELLFGPCGVSFCFGEVATIAKVMIDFGKESKLAEMKGGWVGSVVVNAEGMKAIAELPPLPVIRAQLLGLINTPARQLASVVAGGIRQVVNVLHAYSESGEAAEAEAAA